MRGVQGLWDGFQLWGCSLVAMAGGGEEVTEFRNEWEAGATVEVGTSLDNFIRSVGVDAKSFQSPAKTNNGV